MQQKLVMEILNENLLTSGLVKINLAAKLIPQHFFNVFFSHKERKFEHFLLFRLIYQDAL